MSDLVGKPQDPFSRVVAHILISYLKDCLLFVVSFFLIKSIIEKIYHLLSLLLWFLYTAVKRLIILLKSIQKVAMNFCPWPVFNTNFEQSKTDRSKLSTQIFEFGKELGGKICCFIKSDSRFNKFADPFSYNLYCPKEYIHNCHFSIS